MKSYKCPHCNLTNWMDAEVCKRCWMPNPFHPEMEGINPIDAAPAAFLNENQRHGDPRGNSSNGIGLNDPNLPPPPGLYGHRAGEMIGQTDYSQPRLTDRLIERNAMLSPAEIDEFENAKKKIRSAWKAGRAWCILLFIASLGIILLAIAANSGNEVPGMVTGVIGVFLLGFTVVIGLLTYGIYKKSQFCAVSITVLVCIGLLGNLARVNIIGLLFSIIFIYYFANGIKGISVFNKFKFKYPHLKD